MPAKAGIQCGSPRHILHAVGSSILLPRRAWARRGESSSLPDHEVQECEKENRHPRIKLDGEFHWSVRASEMLPVRARVKEVNCTLHFIISQSTLSWLAQTLRVCDRFVNCACGAQT